MAEAEAEYSGAVIVVINATVPEMTFGEFQKTLDETVLKLRAEEGCDKFNYHLPLNDGEDDTVIIIRIICEYSSLKAWEGSQSGDNIKALLGAAEKVGASVSMSTWKSCPV